MGKAMLITGCASGIGRRVAEDLVARGHEVVLTDINLDALREHAEHLGWTDLERVQLRSLDVRSAQQWDAAVESTVESFGRLDALLNIAGVVFAGNVVDMEAGLIATTLDINVRGTMLGSRAAAQVMKRQGHGHIINVASVAALSPVPGIAVYSASKHAVRAFSLALSLELARDNVDVTLICPGLVDTPMLDAQLDVDAAPGAFTARPLTVSEVSAAIVDALDKRPLERTVTVPFSGQVPLARLINLFPALGARAMPLAFGLGRRMQRRYRRQRHRR